MRVEVASLFISLPCVLSEIYMIYLESFTLPSRLDEDGFILNFPPELEMQCYNTNNAYPFKIFAQKGLSRLELSDITLIYGSNGSGKSTLLNLIAEKIGAMRTSPYNTSPCFPEYLKLCRMRSSERFGVPEGSRIITSDEVFDLLIEKREINNEISRARDELFLEYKEERDRDMMRLSSLDELEEFSRRLDARRLSKSQYTARRIPKDLTGKSNGESAYIYFTKRIEENALYLLDEPENSLSPALQLELVKFIEDSARFYGCQFIISTHSPFILSMKGARIYDLDSAPVRERRWTELENVRLYYNFFKDREGEFEGER